MKKLLLSSVLLAALCSPALCQDNQGPNGNYQGWNGGGGHHGVPGPILGAGLPVIAVGYGVYWLICRRRKFQPPSKSD